MRYRKIIAVYSQNQTQLIHALRGEKADVFKVKAGACR